MSAATVSVTKKNANGDLISIGGVDAADFLANAAILLDSDESVADLQAEIRGVFTPAAAAGGPPAANVVQGNFGGGQQAAPAPPQQAAPGQAPPCPNHQQPARWVPPGVSNATKKPYSGFFACAVSQQGDRSCRLPR